jgi:alanine racemase
MIPLDTLITATGAEALTISNRTIFEGFAHDSRTLVPGDCFVAVRGVHGDGHDFLLDAAERGARAVLVERARLEATLAEQPDLLARLSHAGAVVLAVPDTREALKRYAAVVLAQWRPTVVAVAGSTGKTTTKEAIADVLSLRGPTFRSWRNFNDLLGLPLSIGRLDTTHQFAVVEMGADHPGEIAELCAIVRPRVAVVTGVSPAHLLYLGSIEALAAELASLPASLPIDGIAILNGDDPFTRAMSARTRAPARYFGPCEPGRNGIGMHSIRYAVLPLGKDGRTMLTLWPTLPAPVPKKGGGKIGEVAAHRGQKRGEAIVFPHLHGDHWAYAVLAALTVGDALGVPSAEAVEVLRELLPLPGRMRWLEGNDHAILLDDSHNATPASAEAGLVALRAIGAARAAPRIAVLGDMLRLGDQEEEAHRALGRHAAACADYLVTRGPRAELIAEEAIRAGLAPTHAAVTHTAEDAAEAARAFAGTGGKISPSALSPAEKVGSASSSLIMGERQREGPGPIIYIKGSEEMRMELVTARLLEHPEHAEHLLDRQTQAWQRVIIMRPDRPTWLEVDLSAIAENTRRIAELVGPRVRVLASLKADAYGHGALRVARTVLRNGASWLGVATVSEAVPLRDAGIDAPILVFGYIAPWQAREVVRLDLRATVYSLDAAHALARAARDLEREVRVHVKIDTGMARLGLRAEDVESIVAFFSALRELGGLVVEGVFTHFATADSADQTYAIRQLDRFQTVLDALEVHGLRPPIVHAANSAALLTLPESRFDLVRPGIALYGLAPSDEVQLPAGFRPALAFKTQVAQVKTIPPGDGISYGATYVTSTPMHIAVLPVGYADGFRRSPASWGEVLIRGQRAPLVGRVCMDQCMVNVGHIPSVRPGDEVVLIGRQGDDELSAEAVAARLGTIAYEVVAELLARVPRMS